jgi:hypothetical protein
MGKRGLAVFGGFWRVLDRFWGLLAAMGGFWHPCHVHTFMLITFSRAFGTGIALQTSAWVPE